jgi:putative transposase
MQYDPEKHHRHSIRLKGYDYRREGMYFITICAQHRECLFGEIIDGVMYLNSSGEAIARWWMELTNKFPSIALDEFVVMPNHFHGIIIISNKIGVSVTCEQDAPVTHEQGAHTGAPLPETNQSVGADLRVCPDPVQGKQMIYGGDRIIREQGAIVTCEQGAHTGAPLPKNDQPVGADLRVCPDPVQGKQIIYDGDRHNQNDAIVTQAKGAIVTREQGAHTGAPLPKNNQPGIPQIVQWFKTMTTNEYIRGVKQDGWQPFVGKLWQRNYYEHVIRNDASFQRIRDYIINNPSSWQQDGLHPENPSKW